MKITNAGQVKGSWVKLGNYFFAAGPVQVQLKEDTQQTLTLYADAARLVRTATASTTSVQYVHTDHLGTPQAVTDSGGRVVWRATLEPFGGVTQLNEDADGDGTAVRLNLRAPGQYFDAESGFYYNHFRDYDPATGRYLESDPIGLMGGMNPFSYVGNNPLSFIDPWGLMAEGTPTNEICVTLVCRPTSLIFNHCATFVAACGDTATSAIERQYSLQGFGIDFDPQDSASYTYQADLAAYRDFGGQNLQYPIAPPAGMTSREFADAVVGYADGYQALGYHLFVGPNSNSAAAFPLVQAGAVVPIVPMASALHYYHPPPRDNPGP